MPDLTNKGRIFIDYTSHMNPLFPSRGERISEQETGVEWLLGPLRELMLDTMAGSAFQQSPYFDGSTLAGDFWGWLQSPNWEEAWAFWPSGHFVLWSQRVSSPAETTAPSSGIGPQTAGDKWP